MALQRRLRREMTSGSVPTSDALVLGAIERRGAAASPGQLAADLLMATSNVAASLRLLEREGLIRRGRDPDDARRVLIEITAAGRRYVADDRRRRDTWLCEAINATLSSREQDTLRRAGELMKRLASHGLKQ
ncbi:MarR family winged helix-turn-helix transcriptional regulator [Mycobacterium parmense]|nr:MarR family transcriptional regulator [Mycobacterium parmense]MCV7352683.1 MarR family transcriptional regulator [Mycobacterium parmense]